MLAERESAAGINRTARVAEERQPRGKTKPLGPTVKTQDFQSCDAGSIPAGVTFYRHAQQRICEILSTYFGAGSTPA